MTAQRAKVINENGYYPSHLEIDAASDGDTRLIVQRKLLSHRAKVDRGQLWQRVAERAAH